MTGGVASGKSLVMQMLLCKGAVCFSADQASRVVVGRGSPALSALKANFGEDILLQDGSLNRSRLAGLIFDSVEVKESVNRILHPPILRLLRAQMEGALDDLPHRSIVAVEVPLLFETGMQSWFDSTLIVSTMEKKQIARLKARNGLSEDEARKRIESQWPLSKKVLMANIVISNDESITILKERIDHIWPLLSSGMYV